MKNDPWWGEFLLAEKQKLFWHIGDRAIIIQRLIGEWNTWNIEADDVNSSPLIFSENLSEAQPHGITNIDSIKPLRHLQRKTSEHIKILPALADRSMVVKPVTPIRVLPGEHICLFVSTQLWFSAYTSPKKALLLDIPFWRPSDSWFGPSTREGQISYAKYTDARLQLDALEQCQHRAITPVSIINNHEQTLVIERLNLPVPLLNLYSDCNNQFWTEKLTVSRDANDEIVELKFGEGGPLEASQPIHVSAPRIIKEQNALIRSINSLFA